MMDKKSIRYEKLKCRDGLNCEVRRVQSEQIMRKLTVQPEISGAEVILCYLNYKSEVETISFIVSCLQAGKRVFCPKVLHETQMEFFEIMSLSDLMPGAYGILEPAAYAENGNSFASYVAGRENGRKACACMILPGAAFDKNGNRIGYGKGYYDRYLTEHPDLQTIGICFSCQLANAIPAEDTDQKVHKIITEKEVYTIV